jgi:hypothetical protein
VSEERTPARHPASRRQKAVAFACVLLAIGMMGAWQYTKYAHGHGLFNRFEHGGAILVACIIAAVVFVSALALKDK